MPTAADVGAALRPERYKSLVRKHVIDAWFPRCLDREYGGFLCDFDARWKRRGRQDKLLEFQARHTWAAAELLRIAPHDARLRRAAEHGFAYLRDVMWDSRHGGWFHRLARTGEPLWEGVKHVHGTAYAISACVAVFEALQLPQALDLAREGFAWMDRAAHDDRNGGYFGPLTRDGTVIASSSDNPVRAGTDTIGVPFGTKESNTHSDLLDSLAYLYRATQDAALAARLDEVVDIVTRRMMLPSGALPFVYWPDWTPLPHLVRFGYAFQNVYRLLDIRALTGNDALSAPARRLLDFGLAVARDPRGGYFFAAPATLPHHLGGQDLIVRRKEWWLQFEVLRALLAVARESDDAAPLLTEFVRQQAYIEQRFLDARRGGVTASPSPGSRDDPKSHDWKDASHEARAWLACYDAGTAHDGGGAARKRGAE